MKFLKAEVAELDEEQSALLAKSIRQFLKVGGVITLTEWLELSPIERAMLVQIKSGEAELVETAADALAARMKAGGTSP